MKTRKTVLSDSDNEGEDDDDQLTRKINWRKLDNL